MSDCVPGGPDVRTIGCKCPYGGDCSSSLAAEEVDGKTKPNLPVNRLKVESDVHAVEYDSLVYLSAV